MPRQASGPAAPPATRTATTGRTTPHHPTTPDGNDDDDAQGPCDPTLTWRHEDGCDPANALPGRETDDFIDRIEAYAGDRFAGHWIVRPSDDRATLEIGFVHRTGHDQRFLDAITGHDTNVRAVDRLFSTAELEAVTEVISVPNSVSMLGHQDRENRVHLFVLAGDLEAERARAFSEVRRARGPLIESALEKLPGHGIRDRALERLVRIEPFAGGG